MKYQIVKKVNDKFEGVLAETHDKQQAYDYKTYLSNKFISSLLKFGVFEVLEEEDIKEKFGIDYVGSEK